MGRITSTFDGAIGFEPEFGSTASGTRRVSFPVYVQHSKKGASGEYENTGDTSVIRVTLWGERASEAENLHKGDIVEVKATLIDKEFAKKDGTTGRALQTDWVENVTVKWAGKPQTGGSADVLASFGATEVSAPF